MTLRRRARSRSTPRRSTRRFSWPSEAADANKHDEARKALDKALAVNPSSLDAIALRAALSFVEDKPQEFEAEAAKALAIAPRYGEVYRVAGELAARNYRFDEAVELTRRALALDSHQFARAGRPRLASAAHRRRAGRARSRSRRRSRPIRSASWSMNQST